MKVKEFMGFITSECEVTLIDINGNNDIKTIRPDDPYDELCECEVHEISAKRSANSFELFIERPFTTYAAPLDITYSTWIRVQVRDGQDMHKCLQEEAEKVLESIPISFSIKGHCFDFLDDSTQTGAYYDMAELEN